ncbi:hypothetical protein ACLMJV_07860 [Sinorhizobium meliloti]|uniref:hypothetical protein n=1 Tax=Rhizobium meliloti TaxID=382 RepID=UPI00398D45FD
MTEPRAVPMRLGDIVDLKTAALVTGRSIETIRQWCIKFNIGAQRKVNGFRKAKWQVSLPAAKMIAAEDFDAFDAFLEGDRESEMVREYIITLERAA